jgi:hypothetical protein
VACHTPVCSEMRIVQASALGIRSWHCDCGEPSINAAERWASGRRWTIEGRLRGEKPTRGLGDVGVIPPYTESRGAPTAFAVMARVSRPDAVLLRGREMSFKR